MPAPPSSWKQFFIVARGRSGTDMLRAMLNRHSAVTVAPEALFVINLYHRYRHGAWTQARILRFYNDLWAEDRLVDWWRIERTRLKEDLLRLGEGATFAELCRTVYAHQAAAEKKLPSIDKLSERDLIGDKNPTHALFVPELMALFPQARFIHLVRDYRDNVLSFQNVHFDLSGTAALAERWRAYNEAVLAASRSRPERFFTLRYEDLLAEPESRLGDVCAFLGVDFEAPMLSFHEDRDDVRDWQTNLAVPLDSSRAEGWRERMDPAAVRTVDAVCARLGARFGYETADKGAPPAKSPAVFPGIALGRLASFLERVIFRLPFWLRQVILKTYRRRTKSL